MVLEVNVEAELRSAGSYAAELESKLSVREQAMLAPCCSCGILFQVLKDFDDDDDDVVVVVGAVVVVVMCFLILISVMSVCCFLLCSLLSICCMLPKPNSRSQANPKCQFSLGASNVAPSSMSPRLPPFLRSQRS